MAGPEHRFEQYIVQVLENLCHFHVYTLSQPTRDRPLPGLEEARAAEPGERRPAVRAWRAGRGRHDAAADTAVLPAVLEGMVESFDLPRADGEQGGLEELVDAFRPTGAMDRHGWFVRRPDGVVVFGKSKNRGQPAISQPGMLRWMLRDDRDIPEESRAVARRLLATVTGDG